MSDRAMKRTALERNPEKIRDWLYKPRQPLKRSPRKTRAKLTPAKIREVRQRCKGRCVVCGSKRNLHRHHVLPVRNHPQHELEALNLVLACEGCHDNHERAHRRIRFAELPPAVQVWVMTLGGRESLFIERTYPRA